MTRNSRRATRAGVVSKRFIKGSRKVRGIISMLRTLRGPKQIRLWMAFSQADLGAELARLLNKPSPIGKSTVSEWESHTKPISRQVIDAYGVLIANRVALLTRRPNDVGIKLEVNSPWRITVWSWCAICGKEFELQRANQTRCPKCRK